MKILNIYLNINLLMRMCVEEDRLYQLTNALKCLEKNQEVNETSQDEDTVLPEQAAITDRTLQLSMTLLTHIQEVSSIHYVVFIKNETPFS